MANWLANTIDNVGTALNLPELGWSEGFAGNNKTVNTGRVDFTDNGLFNSTSSPTRGLVKGAYASNTASQKPSNPTGNKPVANDPYDPYDPIGTAAAQATARATANNLAQYDQAINTYDTSLGRLDTQRGIADGNINQQFNTNQNELNTNKAAQQATYNNQTTQNGQNLRTNKNTIADQASNGLRGLQRMLGAYGAGGSSDAMFVAPQAVADQASQQRAGAGQTFAQNQSGLDTNWNNFLGEDTNSRKKLDDWKTGQLRNVEATSTSTRQDLLTKLADLRGQRSAAAGGSYATGAQSYLDQASGLNGTIDNLARNVATYDGTKATYVAPTLDSYQSQGANASMNQSAGSADSYLSQILGMNKDKTKALY